MQGLTYECNRMWLWWWTTQLGEVQELAEPAHGAGISVLGDAGGLNLVEQGLATAYNPVVVGDADRYEERESFPNRTVAEISISESTTGKTCPRPRVCHDES